MLKEFGVPKHSDLDQIVEWLKEMQTLQQHSSLRSYDSPTIYWNAGFA